MIACDQAFVFAGGFQSVAARAATLARSPEKKERLIAGYINDGGHAEQVESEKRSGIGISRNKGKCIQKKITQAVKRTFWTKYIEIKPQKQIRKSQALFSRSRGKYESHSAMFTMQCLR